MHTVTHAFRDIQLEAMKTGKPVKVGAIYQGRKKGYQSTRNALYNLS